MIIKSFKLFESLDEYNIFIIEINDADELEYVMKFIGQIDMVLYNRYVMEENDWHYPNWLFVYKDDIARMFTLYEPSKEKLKERMEEGKNIYPEIFNINNLNKFKNIFQGLKTKKMYSPRKIQR